MTTHKSADQEQTSAPLPALRFPEFQQEEWTTVSGSTAFEQISNKTSNGSLPVLAITQEHGAIPRELIDYHVTVTEQSLEGYKIVEVGDFIISLRSFQGGIEYSRYRGICSPAYIVLRPRSHYSNEYFRHFFKTERLIQALNRNLEGIRDGKMVSWTQFSQLVLPIPGPSEQKKIAECLSSLDELIAAERRKLDALKAHKKGLMQQLFPAEGETTPRLRFPEFRNADEWETKCISDLGTIVTGSTPSTANPQFYGGGILFVSPADISDERFISRTNTTLTEGGFSHTRPLPPHSILFVCIGSTIGKLAQNLVECASNQQINAVIPSAEHCAAFLYYTLAQAAPQIAARAGRHAVPIINKTAFGNVEVLIPKQAEQERIAECLSSLDEKITAQSQQIAALHAHKAGLMQQLFPSLDEVQA